MDARELLEIVAEFVNADRLVREREYYGSPDVRDEVGERFAAALDEYVAERR